MIIVFEKSYLKELYEKGKTSEKKYRIEFIVKETKQDIIVSLCNILELSNHYE